VTGSEFNDEDKLTTTHSTETQTGRTMETQDNSRSTGGINCDDRSNDDGQLKRGQCTKQVNIETNAGPIMNEESELRRMSQMELGVVKQNVFKRNNTANYKCMQEQQDDPH